MTRHADDLLAEFHLEVNYAEKTASETVACSHRERAVALALELDRWLTGGNEPPTNWCVAFVRALAAGDVSELAVRTSAAESSLENPPLGATCANQPLSTLPTPT